MFANYENIIREVVAAAKPTFEQWVSKKKFINLETKSPSSYNDLPELQKQKIKKQYEIAMEKLEEDLNRKKEQQKKIRREKQKERGETWTEARIKREAIAWAKDAIADYPPQVKKPEGLSFEDVVDDLASNFYDQEGVPEFFKKRRMSQMAALGYLADIMMTVKD